MVNPTMMTMIENAKKKTMDHQHHTNKATSKRMEGKQERTLKEEEDRRLMDKEITNAEEEEEEAETREEGGDHSILVQHQQIGLGPSAQEQSMEGTAASTIEC